ncbi:MAG: hypothetical protein KME13_03705 [Myxacorys californica WJT36-NPBG1]|jgi:hypothetical protein|nr:hypothetical protein [Myxacorys californica WJT36-NPBG1]
MSTVINLLHLLLLLWSVGWLKTFLAICLVLIGLLFLYCLLAAIFFPTHSTAHGDEHSELVRLCGNTKTANRLIKHIQSQHPKKSLKWCCDKALWDLQRDRRRGL